MPVRLVLSVQRKEDQEFKVIHLGCLGSSRPAWATSYPVSNEQIKRQGPQGEEARLDLWLKHLWALGSRKTS